MNRLKMSRPSLKITRHADRDPPDAFVFEVWNPFAGRYQQVASIDIGLRRIDELTHLICQMWVQRHPKRDTLIDVPDPAETEGIPESVPEGLRWAEFRVNATTFRSYDMRGFDRLGWMRAAGLNHATTVTCGKVGYAAASFAAS